MPDLAKPEGFKLITVFLEKRRDTRRMFWTCDSSRIAGTRPSHGGSGRAESSAARTWFLARDCDSRSDAGCTKQKNTLRGGKGRDSKGSTSKGTGSKGGNRGESSERSKGVKIKSNGNGIFKGEGDPLKQRLVSRTQCRVCGEEVRSLGRRLPSSLKKRHRQTR